MAEGVERKIVFYKKSLLAAAGNDALKYKTTRIPL